MKNLSLTLIFTAICAISFAQKINVTNTHNAFKRYVPLVGDLETNKKALAEAKAYIDLAAVNSETANALDMHKYRGKVYYSLMETAAIEAALSGKEADTALLSSYEKVVKASFTTVLNAPKSKGEKDEVRDFINPKITFYFNNGHSMFTAKKYPEATMMFLGAFKISQLINEPYNDAAVNTKLSFARAVDTLLDTKNFDEADKLGRMVCESLPKDIDILISLINLNLQKNDIVATEKFLNEATNIDSTNVQLFVILGTSLLDLKQKERAEKAFQRAIQIDPFYPDAVYQYSSFLFNWSFDIRNAASDLKFNDPKIPAMEKEAKEIMERVLIQLLPYLEKFPEDKTALEIGWKTFAMLDNEEKKNELKTRWDALK
jgi:tetratricopeptide (TPR) repeat protein